MVAAMKIALSMEVPVQRTSVITRAYSFEIKRDNVDDGGCVRLRTPNADVNDVRMKYYAHAPFRVTLNRILTSTVCSLSVCRLLSWSPCIRDRISWWRTSFLAEKVGKELACGCCERNALSRKVR